MVLKCMKGVQPHHNKGSTNENYTCIEKRKIWIKHRLVENVGKQSVSRVVEGM